MKLREQDSTVPPCLHGVHTDVTSQANHLSINDSRDPRSASSPSLIRCVSHQLRRGTKLTADVRLFQDT